MLLSVDPSQPSCVGLGMANSIFGIVAGGFSSSSHGPGRPGLVCVAQVTLLPFKGRLAGDGFYTATPARPVRSDGAAAAALRARLAALEAAGELRYYVPPPEEARHDAARCGDPAGCRVCAAQRADGRLCARAGCGARGAAAGPAGSRLSVCSACRAAWYCGPACAKAAWPGHRAACGAAAAARAAAAAHAARPLSRADDRLVSYLSSLPRERALPGGATGDDSFWTFRRLGFTAEDNPRHMCFVIAPGDVTATNDGVVHVFRTAALDPTAAEMLRAVQDAARGRGRRPTMLAIDSKPCVAEVASVLVHAHFTVGYYPPPSEEELDVVTRMTHTAGVGGGR